MKGSFSPEYQMRLIGQGHHLLPWFQMPAVREPDDDAMWASYYETAVKQAARLKLPISFVGTQWESLLTSAPAFRNLPGDKNPNVVDTVGKIRAEVSPFGPLGPWREAGKSWTSSPLLRKIQEIYPDPPLVLFVSNNEQPKLQWSRVEEDRRYLQLYGPGRDDNFKRQTVAQEWIEHYRALQQGMRDGLRSPKWKRSARFIGYNAFGPSYFGRWNGWGEYSLETPGRIDPSPLEWDGGSPAFYVNNWNSSTDYTVFSPQVEAINWVFMLNEAHRLNPQFWFEMSTWDGHVASSSTDKRAFYAGQGQTYSPARYGGMVQFGMWLLRPRVVREFRGSNETLAESEPYFRVIVAAVDRLYANSILRAFWRGGKLVPNRTHRHPYQASIPSEYGDVDRWFLLDTDLDPRRPWELGTEIPVYSLALVLGRTAQRVWLVYAQSPTGQRNGVRLTIPGFGSATINASVAGSFWVIEEANGSVRALRSAHILSPAGANRRPREVN